MGLMVARDFVRHGVLLLWEMPPIGSPCGQGPLACVMFAAPVRGDYDARLVGFGAEILKNYERGRLCVRCKLAANHPNSHRFSPTLAPNTLADISLAGGSHCRPHKRFIGEAQDFSSKLLRGEPIRIMQPTRAIFRVVTQAGRISARCRLGVRARSLWTCRKATAYCCSLRWGTATVGAAIVPAFYKTRCGWSQPTVLLWDPHPLFNYLLKGFPRPKRLLPRAKVVRAPR